MKFINSYILIVLTFISGFYFIPNIVFAQDNNSSENFTLYEGLGLKMKYFDPYITFIPMDDPTCNDVCSVSFIIPVKKLDNKDDFTLISITQYLLNGARVKDECKCDTLIEFVKYDYENFISKTDNFYFINDNKTILNNNKSAIQLEYERSLNDDGKSNGFDVFTQNNDAFYKISLSADKNIRYSKYLDDFKKMINSLEFISTTANKTNQKQPSFMTDINETNSKSSIPNLANENTLRLNESVESNKIQIRSHNSYVDPVGYMHVIGEIENNTFSTAEFVKIIGTFYDDNGNVVGTSSTYTDPSDIYPKQVAPFDLILSGSTIPTDQIEEYKLMISYR